MNEIPPEVSRLDLFTVLDAVANGVSIASPDGRIVYSNAAANRILGAPPTDELPDKWAEHYGVFLPDSDHPFPVEEYPLVRALAGEEVHELEMVIRNPSLPEEVTISSSSRPLLAPDGSTSGAVVVFRDVTKLRQTQRTLERTNAELQESQRLKDELTAFVVHDLKNPLTTIMVLSDFLLEGGSDSEAVRTDVTDIRNAAARIHRMALDLLDLQLAEDGSLKLEVETIATGELLEEVRQTVRRRARRLVVSATGPERSIVADRALLGRVFVNLIDNCIKYGPADGRISIESSVGAGERVCFTVQDEGPGVPEEMREKVFEKYARVERGADLRSSDSRGLGLRFCKVIVEAHGGRIWIEDGQPSAARFCVELPAPAE